MPSSEASLILASSSPRRREILSALGLKFTVCAADIDETMRDGESAGDMVLRLAIEKATVTPVALGQIVIGADTAVVLGAAIFGKPGDRDDALAMLAALSGKTHQVMTGVAVATAGGVETVRSVTDVRFREIHPDEARRYWQSGEPQGKAGAYAIQGRGGVFVEAIMGSYTGVVGLPVFETGRLLAAAGLAIPPELDRSA